MRRTGSSGSERGWSRCSESARVRAAPTRLYISATPTRPTVDFYRGLGAQVLATPDPALPEKERADLHLVLRLDAGPAGATHVRMPEP